MEEAQRWSVTYTNHVKQKRNVYHNGFLLLQSSRNKFYNHLVDQYASNLMMVVKSLILSISETYRVEKPDACYILYSLVKLLQSSSYDAALCATKWHGVGKVPGGEHEFIDVIGDDNSGGDSERYIIDIDFRSQFQIARVVKAYNVVLSSLPAIYVGTTARLNELLQMMVEAASGGKRSSHIPYRDWKLTRILQTSLGENARTTII